MSACLGGREGGGGGRKEGEGGREGDREGGKEASEIGRKGRGRRGREVGGILRECVASQWCGWSKLSSPVHHVLI